MLRLGLALVAALSSTAVAGRLHVAGQLGVALHEEDDDPEEPAWFTLGATRWTVSLALAVTAPVTAWLDIGLRTGVMNRLTVDRLTGSNTMGTVAYYTRYAQLPIDVALTARFHARGAWIAPWLGLRISYVAMSEYDTVFDRDRPPTRAPRNVGFHHESSTWVHDAPALGVTAGYELVRRPQLTFGPFVEVSRTPRAAGGAPDQRRDPEVAPAYLAATFGLAVRH